MIRIEDLKKKYGRRTVLDGVTVTFERGKVSAIFGPSGCGKSTLLRCINGLERFDSGLVRVGDVTLGPLGGDERAAKKAMHAIRLTCGMVFQQYGLFSHMTALANVIEAPVHVRGQDPGDAREKALALLAKVGLSHRKDAFPREMSGGEQQRVAIARALAMEPSALLLDEPTSALDPERKIEVIRVLEALAKEGTTMVIVTHEPAVVRSVADRAIMLRGGRVAVDGPPAEVLGASGASGDDGGIPETAVRD
jgi:polar amino acid transport system ATP-binding protein